MSREPHSIPATRSAVALALVIALLAVFPAHAARAQPRSNEPPRLNESAACDEPGGVLAPLADVIDPNSYRGLPADAEVRGPWADFLGRGLGDVQDSLVLWTVPMSGGVKVWVHERALPAFAEVSRLLAIEQGKGHYYPVRLVGTFSWRRISGSFRMSQHSFGTTMDINWDTNPQLGPGPPPPRSEYTDMPIWFVTAWQKAGFCWGGDWVANKDPMHFSWKGPGATPGYGSVPDPFSPDTSGSPFTGADHSFNPGFGPAVGDDIYLVADASRDGAADLIRVRRVGEGLLAVTVAYASHSFRRCGTEEIRTPPIPFTSFQIGMADLTGDAGADVWAAGTVDGKVSIAILDLGDPAAGWTVLETGVSRNQVSRLHFANRNNDTHVDLYAIRNRDADIRLRVFSGAGGFTNKILDRVIPVSPKARPMIEVADRGGDGVPDLFALSPGSSTVKIVSGASGYTLVRSVGLDIPASTTSVQFADRDGDGRDDLYALGAAGSGQVFTGGTGVGKADFWFRPVGWECSQISNPAIPWDFDGDGFAEVVAAAPTEDMGTVIDAGAVYVAPGGPALVGGPGSMWSQETTGVGNKAEKGDRLGTGLASGDFDGDGYADLAAGAPGERLSGLKRAGLVSVIFGGSDGLDADGDQVWTQGSPKVPGEIEAADRFGAAVHSGDFDGDGYDDLAVSSPGEGLGAADKAGVVHILGGDRWKGLVGSGWLHPNLPGVPGAAKSGDGFGAALAVGDFDGDGFDDLAVSSPTAPVAGNPRAGTVHVVFGGSGGLDTADAVMFRADTAHADGTPETGALFGADLAACDIDGDGKDDLAIGSPGAGGSGSVTLLRGKVSGLAVSGWPILAQGGALGGEPDTGDSLGDAVGCGDLNGDGFGEVVIGVPGEDVNGVVDSGMVRVVPGSAAGPDTETATVFSQAREAIWNIPEPGDVFGASIVVADLDHDGALDLVIGSPGEGINGRAAAGMVVLVPGRINGLLSLGRSKPLYQGDGLGGVLEEGDRTGS